MPSAPLPSLPERTFLLSALQQSIRLDNRPLDALRPLSISFGDEFGIADVRLGKTRVMCTINAKLERPYEDRKFDGVFTIQVEMSQLAGAYVELGRPSPLETHLSTTLDTTLRRSGALSTESLCLLAGQCVWHLNATIHILSHDGGLATAASIAVVAALENMRINDTEVKGGEVRVFGEDERDLVRICGGGGMMFWPVGIEFASFPIGSADGGGGRGGGAVMRDADADADADAMDYDGTPAPDSDNNTTTMTITDPTLAESQLASSNFLVNVTESGDVIQMTKPGGDTVDAVGLLRCVDKAVDTVRGVHKIIKGALERDKERRGEGKGVQAVLRSENER